MSGNPAPWSEALAADLFTRNPTVRPTARLTLGGRVRRCTALTVSLDAGRVPHVLITASFPVASRAESLAVDPNYMTAEPLDVGYTGPAGTQLTRLGQYQPVQRRALRSAGTWTTTVTLASAETYMTEHYSDVNLTAINSQQRYGSDAIRGLIGRGYYLAADAASYGDPLRIGYPIVGELPLNQWFDSGDDGYVWVPQDQPMWRGVQAVTDALDGYVWHDGTSWIMGRNPVAVASTPALRLPPSGADVSLLDETAVRAVTRVVVTYTRRDRNGNSSQVRSQAGINNTGRGEVDARYDYGTTVIRPQLSAAARARQAAASGTVMGITTRSRWWLRPYDTVEVTGYGSFLARGITHDVIRGTMRVDLVSPG